eukprot:TRINITY_DN5041_c0_g1_i3.p1 TRINITY_DN5041_c0_g1~~TRINITY_DN5041_c0_g1_i3.p1  ORF type:complete len:453 (+),score=91.84 TRINITY_DN5041_c0_g1_i3:62-1420(+)
MEPSSSSSSPPPRNAKPWLLLSNFVVLVLFGFFATTLFSLKDAKEKKEDQSQPHPPTFKKGSDWCDPNRQYPSILRHNPNEHHDEHWREKIKKSVQCQVDVTPLYSFQLQNPNYTSSIGTSPSKRTPLQVREIESCDMAIEDLCIAQPQYKWKSLPNRKRCLPSCQTYDANTGVCGPSFFLIGAQKAGTTSLFSFLSKHPHVKRPVKKELHYYDHDPSTNQKERLSKYKSLFPLCTDCVSGEASGSYSLVPDAAQLIRRDWPNARIVLLIRDPISRAHAHYRMVNSAQWRAHHTFETHEKGIVLGSFAEEMGENMRRLREEQLVDEVEGILDLTRSYTTHPGVYGNYLERGMYASIVEEWLRHFPPHQLLVVRFEDLVDPSMQSCVLRQVLRFIGLQYENLDYDIDWTMPPDPYASLQDLSDSRTKDRLTMFYRAFNQRLDILMGRSMGYFH